MNCNLWYGRDARTGYGWQSVYESRHWKNGWRGQWPLEALLSQGIGRLFYKYFFCEWALMKACLLSYRVCYHIESVIISGLLSYWVYYHIMSVNWGIKSASHKFVLTKIFMKISRQYLLVQAHVGSMEEISHGRLWKKLTWTEICN